MAEPPDVGTAWLLLSHATWIAIPVAAVSLANSVQNKGLALAWEATGLLFDVWTLYAVATTWQSNRAVSNPVFGDFGFAFVSLLVLAIGAVVIYSLVYTAIEPAKRPQQLPIMSTFEDGAAAEVDDADEDEKYDDNEAKEDQDYDDDALGNDFDLDPAASQDLGGDELLSQHAVLSQAPALLSHEFKEQIISGQKTSRGSFAFPPFRRQEPDAVDIMQQSAEDVVKLGRKAHDPVHEAFVQKFCDKQCLNLPKVKKLGVAGVDNAVLREWMNALHRRPRGRVMVLGGSAFVACAFAHAYKEWVSSWVSDRVILCQGVRPQGAQPILAYFGSLCGLTGLDEDSITEFNELGPSQQAEQIRGLQNTLNVNVVIVLNAEANDFQLLCALAAHSGVQVVVTTSVESLDIEVEEVQLPSRAANADKQALEAFCYCSLNECKHADRPRCVKEVRNVFFLLNDEHFIAVPPVLEAAERAEIIRDHEVPVAPNTVERVLDVKYLFFHRQAQADLSNLLPIITYDQAQADNWNRFYRGLLSKRSQGLPVHAFVSYNPEAKDGEAADARFEALEHLAAATYYVGERVVLLVRDDCHAAGSLGTILEIRDKRPFVCFDTTGSSSLVDVALLTVHSSDGMRSAQAKVFPIACAFSVAMDTLLWGQIGEMVVYDADAVSIALALESITDLFVMSHSLETQIAETRLTAPTSVDFDALMQAAADQDEDPELDDLGEPGCGDPMEEVEIFG